MTSAASLLVRERAKAPTDEKIEGEQQEARRKEWSHGRSGVTKGQLRRICFGRRWPMRRRLDVLHLVFWRRGSWQTRHCPTSHSERFDRTETPTTRRNAGRNIAARPGTRQDTFGGISPCKGNEGTGSLPRWHRHPRERTGILPGRCGTQRSSAHATVIPDFTSRCTGGADRKPNYFDTGLGCVVPTPTGPAVASSVFMAASRTAAIDALFWGTSIMVENRVSIAV